MGRTELNSTDLHELGRKLPVFICPGFHDARLTEQWVRSLPSFTQPHTFTGFPADLIAVHRWLTQTIGEPANAQPLVAVGFSAGVVGMAGALGLWQQQGGKVARFFAIDGWGMPLVGLPVCRLSHDEFTHWSSLPLGSGKVNFYADPPVDHLAMWGQSEQVVGWQVSEWQSGKATGMAMTARVFLQQQLQLAWKQAS